MNASIFPNATVFFPSQLHWTSQELAEAVPLRLHELFAVDAVRNDARACGAGADSPWQRQRPRNYLPAPLAPAFFRVR